MTKNVYIHIPFCKSKCNYCSFVSFDKLELKENYINALNKQINYEYKGEELETLYIGGGTPSLLTIKKLEALLCLFEFKKKAEITVEINPESVTFEYLRNLRELGINRLSIGTQTFNDSILNLIGRRHNAEQAKMIVDSAKEAGFDNVSLDLIYGLPTQSTNDFENDLKEALNLNIQHISLYGLKIEEGCYFNQNPPANIPTSDTQADMYLRAVDKLKSVGFIHYEVSNFSKSGFESKHNLNYWDNSSYYGFGCAASGYISNTRYTNEINLEKYIKNPLLKLYEQKLSEQEILEESIFLGFRKIDGINIKQINQKFGIDFNEKYTEILKKYSNYFIKTSEGYKLTLEGILISNEILSEFISD